MASSAASPKDSRELGMIIKIGERKKLVHAILLAEESELC